MASFKNFAKRAVRRTPVLKSFFLRLDYFQNKINECEERLNQSESKINTLYAEMNERFSQDQKLIEDLTLRNRNCKLQQRFLFKALNSTPVKVVYIVEELSVTKNILSVIKKQNEDKNFEVILLNMWYKSYKGENYTFVRPDIEKIIDKNEYTVIESYNPETDSWIDLEALNPDYVFFPRPYDYYRKEEYHIPVVAKYARTCYIPYCIQTIGGEVEDMMLTKESGYLDYFFLDNSLRKTVVDAALCDTQFSKIGHSVYCGYPGFDMLRSAKEIKNNDTKTFTVLWLPRWHTGEGNCHFFDYIYVLLDYASADENSRIILRPHPLCFQNFINSGELTEEQLEGIKERYSEPMVILPQIIYLLSFWLILKANMWFKTKKSVKKTDFYYLSMG